MNAEVGRVTRTATLHLDATVEKVFPLFNPVGERLWSEHWRPQFLYPASGAVESGMVFQTAKPGQPDTLWVVVTYDPAARFIEYLRMVPEEQVAQISVRCEPSDLDRTSAVVTYTITALGTPGRSFIAGFTEEHYHHWMSTWEVAINHYLHHGRALSHHA